MGTVVGSWRLKVILIFVIFEVTLHVVQGALYGAPKDPLQTGGDLPNILLGAWNWVTFNDMGMHPWALVFVNLIQLVLVITLAYIVYSAIKEWIPLT